MRSYFGEILLIILILGTFGNASTSSTNDSGWMSLTAQIARLFQDGSIPSDSNYFYQWGMNNIDAPEAWGVTHGDPGVTIAVLDSGVDRDHPDLEGKIIASVNFTDSDTFEDMYGHGTHVAGVAAAASDNDLGITGVGFDSSLMNVKVLEDDGKGYCSRLAKGVRWAVDNGAEVVNLSVVVDTPSASLESAIDYAWENGAVIVAAAGNDGNSDPRYPAYYSNCIAVAATDTNDSLASFSARGDWVDVAAPGVRIYSLSNDGGFEYKSGTSMATPYVAGLAALIFDIVEDTNGNGYLNDEVRSIIESSCDDLSDINHGRINAFRCVELAQNQ
ncbi:MAG: S8 family peptidase [Chloroflexota bacterium]|nr:S8 family peptidase [Chloroflexota bacterium]